MRHLPRFSALLLLAAAAAPPTAAEDPRYQRDARCPPAVTLDAPGSLRQCRSCGYLTVSLPATATAADCAYACCGDWSCQTFTFTPPSASPAPANASSPLTGAWANHDSLRGVSGVSLVENTDGSITGQSLDPAVAFWSTCAGRRVGPAGLFLVFDGHASNNRSGVISPDGTEIFLERLSFDPPGFTQNFTRSSGPANATCVFQDDIPPLQPAPAGSEAVSGLRAFLPGQAPPFAASTFFASATLNSTVLIGADGDEFPATWASDGNLYSGAGDNSQPSRGISGRWNSPASMFRVTGLPTDDTYPLQAFAAMGSPFAPANSSFALANCPSWGRGLANIKSSGALFVNGTLYWAVSCFNYGDDPAFNRQRYGPAWLVRSRDFGATWDDAGAPVFAGRLAAPRIIQAGQAYADAPDEYVYLYFPGTTNNASFFECNDAVWLGRVPTAQIWLRAAYEFFVGFGADGAPQWDSDDTLAAPVYSWPLHTSVQNALYSAALKRYLLPNWVWISMDGNPRPDHSPDERNARTARQRTQLVLLEAPTPWGPFSVFLRDDNWQYSDGSSGAYTPVLMPSWLDSKGVWMVSTQCCGTPQFAPDNHYSFNAQRLDWVVA